MSEKHYKTELSAYLNDELSPDENCIIGEHLRQCADCRKEYDEIKLGAAFARLLPRGDAPESLWNKIEKEFHGKQKRNRFSFYPQPAFLKSPVLVFAPILLILLFGVWYFAIYRNLSNPPREIVANKSQISNSSDELPLKNPAAWTIEAITGNPQAGSQKILTEGRLTIGEILETDANSRARLEVADIGNVEIEPNSRLKLIKTNQNEHRLSFERGIIHAAIIAPPRLFIVDTPSAVAVDLGCEYTLEVDKNGDNKLYVTSGYVSLERDGFESIVPAGAICLSKKGRGLGTPFFSDARKEFQNAVYNFDFKSGGDKSLQLILSQADPPDSLTLWHLLARVPESGREQIFNKLISFAKLPAGATKAGILRLDKTMLEAWRIEMEALWFEGASE